MTILEKIDEGCEWIRKAEMKYGMYGAKAGAVRRYFLGLSLPREYPPVPVPKELEDLGYKERKK